MVKKLCLVGCTVLYLLLLPSSVCPKIHENPANDLVEIINWNRTEHKLPKLKESPGLGCMALQYVELCSGNCTGNNTMICKPPEDDFTEVFGPNCGVELPTFGTITGHIVGCHSKYLEPSLAFSQVLVRDNKTFSLLRNKSHNEVGVGLLKGHRSSYWCVLFSDGQTNSTFVLEDHGKGIKQKKGCFSGSTYPCNGGQRGLCHAYWAPNFWVFYIILDKGLAFLLRKVGFDIQAPAASFTGGLVGDSSPFAVLPWITPMTTFLMVLLALSPSLIKAWRNPQPKMIARWVAYAYCCGFLFGWHVHEKASLHFVIPLAIVAVESLEDAKHYYAIAIVSCYSLFPLLFEPQEYPIKVLLLLLHSILMWLGFSAQFYATPATTKTKGNEQRLKEGFGSSTDRREFNICWVGKLYLLGLLFVEIWGQFLHPYLLGNKLPFVPLMLISVYCALGIMYSWIWQLGQILKS